MRRSNLVSFALGATVSLVSCGGVYWYRSVSEKDANPYLVVFAPDIIPADSDLDDLNSVSIAAGDGIRTCGVNSFDMELRVHGFTYDIPITEENTDALRCVVETIRGVDDEIELGFKVS